TAGRAFRNSWREPESGFGGALFTPKRAGSSTLKASLGFGGRRSRILSALPLPTAAPGRLEVTPYARANSRYRTPRRRSEPRMTAWAVRALAALWFALFVTSFVVFQLAVPEGTGFARGLNRLAAFLTWQGAALVVAVVGALVMRGAAEAVRDKWRWVGF